MVRIMSYVGTLAHQDHRLLDSTDPEREIRAARSSWHDHRDTVGLHQIGERANAGSIKYVSCVYYLFLERAMQACHDQ